jgi:PKD repeat protein
MLFCRPITSAASGRILPDGFVVPALRKDELLMRFLRNLALPSVLLLELSMAGGPAALPAAAFTHMRPLASQTATALSVTVQGNHLVNGKGQVIRLLGVNRSGTEYACAQGWGIFDGPSDAASIAVIAGWHTNVVRVPLNEDCWLGINGVNPLHAGANYQTAIANYVAALHASGIYAILELHWTAAGTTLASGQQPMPDADHAPTFWSSVATAYKNDPAVIFDLFNEPYPDQAGAANAWACWRDGCSISGFTAAGMQSLVTAVRNAGATTQPIMLGGLGYSSDLSQWLAFKPSDPDNGLVGSFHLYNFAACTVLRCWNTVIGGVAAVNPVVTGELGENDCGHTFIDGYMPWADTNGVSYLGWAWNPYDCSTFPSLISDYAGTPTAFGIGLRDHLAALASSTSLTVTSSGSTLSGAAPLTVSFIGSATGGTAPYAYSWNFGDGSATSSTQNPGHSYAAAGSYSAVLTVTDSLGHSGSATALSIHVLATLAAVAAGSPTLGDAPLAVNFTGTPSGGTSPYTYSWSFGDATPASVGQNPSHTYASAGSFSARMTVTDGTGATALSNTVGVTVSPIPSVTASAAPGVGDSPMSVTFTATPSGGTGPFTYSWTFGDGGTSTTQNPTHIYSSANAYIAHVTLTDAAAHTATGSASVTVNPGLSASSAASPGGLDVGLAVSFTGSGSGGTLPYGYSWDFGDGSPAATSQNPSHSYALAGSYKAVLTVSDGVGASVKAAALTITVNALPGVTAGATPSAGDAPLAVALTATPSGGTGPYSYSWSFGDGSPASTSQNPSHSYSMANAYTATVTLTDASGQEAGGQVGITVAPALVVNGSTTPSSGSAPLAVDFSGTATGGKAPYTYAWATGDGTTSSSQNFVHSYAVGGTYTATLTVKDNNGGAGTVSLKVSVSTISSAPAGSSITPATGSTSGEAPPTSQAGPGQPDPGTGSGAQPPAAGGSGETGAHSTATGGSGETGAHSTATSGGGGNGAWIQWIIIVAVVAAAGATLAGLGMLIRIGFAALRTRSV